MTGGAGYVGSACLRWALAHGHDVVAYDNMSEGNRGAVPEADRRLIVGDLLDRSALEEAIRSHDAEAVMHFAALASVPDSIDDPDRYWDANVLGTKNVLDSMRACGVQRLVFSSTAATYGFHGEMPLTETSDQDPETPYGSTKLAAEWMIREYSRAYGLGFTIMRYFNACGADIEGGHGEDRHVESHVIPIVFQAANGQRDTMRIFGDDWPTPDGTCIRDYVHVQDLASAHEMALHAIRPGSGRAYNLGTGTGTSVRQIVDACADVVGRPIPHEVAPRRQGDPAVLVASSDAIRGDLGWSPQRSDIHTILESAWTWHSSHPDGYAAKVTTRA